MRAATAAGKTHITERLKKKILFIVNPISGVGRQKVIEKLIEKRLDKTVFDFELAYTKASRHGIALSAEAAQRGVDVVVAVGGDGSVNEIGRSLIHTGSALAIIPAGSGNGLARHLHIPMDLDKAMQVINRCRITSIDTVTINQEHYLGMAGVGFDAHIGWEFARFGKRGFSSYVKVFLREYPSYKPRDYELWLDGKQYKKNALLISFANGSQYGNNAEIAPEADLTDGMIDVCILRDFHLGNVPGLAWRLFNKKMKGSRFLETIRAREVVVHQQAETAHIDGEPVLLGKEIRLKVDPLSLKVVV
jgi:YegS/Rv2252/BmrU family lipid kinase